MNKLVIIFSVMCFLNGSAQAVSVTQEAPSSVTSNSTFTVTLKIQKGELRGIARLQQILPFGFQATPLETGDARFSFEGQALKLIWIALPADPSFTVSYKITVLPSVLGVKGLTGTFSFIDEEGKKSVEIQRKNVEVLSDEGPVTVYATGVHSGDDSEAETTVADDLAQSAEQSADHTNGPENSATDEKVENTRPVEPVSDDNLQDPIAAEVEEVPDAPDNKTTNDVVYRVQIGAGANLLDDNYFKRRFSLDEHIYIVMQGGMYRYAVGAFSNYKAASEHKSKINVDGAFVVAYLNDKRISLQEAAHHKK